MRPKIKRDKTPQQALTSLMRLCARSERSSGDALRLMRGWGVEETEARKVLARLLNDGFIDDSRYAGAFVRDKIRFGGWGVRKIATALRAKGVAREIIDEALSEVDGDDMRERLITILRRRLPSIKAKSAFELRDKLLRYAVGRGYDFAIARECIEELVKADDESEFL